MAAGQYMQLNSLQFWTATLLKKLNLGNWEQTYTSRIARKWREHTLHKTATHNIIPYLT